MTKFRAIPRYGEEYIIVADYIQNTPVDNKACVEFWKRLEDEDRLVAVFPYDMLIGVIEEDRVEDLSNG